MSWDRSGGSGRSEFNFKYFPSRFILLSRKLTKSPLALPSRSPMPTPEPPHALCVTGVPNKAQKGGCFQRLPCSCSRAVSAGRLVQTGLKAGLSVRSHAGILLCNEQNRLLFFTANPVEATQLPGEAGDREDPGAPTPQALQMLLAQGCATATMEPVARTALQASVAFTRLSSTVARLEPEETEAQEVATPN